MWKGISINGIWNGFLQRVRLYLILKGRRLGGRVFQAWDGDSQIRYLETGDGVETRVTQFRVEPVFTIEVNKTILK